MKRPLALCATILLALALSLGAAEPWSGRPLEPGAGRPGTPSRQTDEGPFLQVGLDGPPAWYWPDLPGTEVTYRVALEVPDGRALHGLLVGLAGSRHDSLTMTMLQLIVRNPAGQALLDSAQIFLRGSEDLDTLLLGADLSLDGLDTVLVDLVRAQPWSPVWVTADDDCLPGNRSWIRVPALSADFQPLERDLNVRLLFQRPEADLNPPALHAPRELSCHPSRNSLPLRVRVREESGVDTVRVLSPLLPGGELGLSRLGRSGIDADWEEWGAGLPASLLLADGLAQELQLRARDLAGNETLQSLWLRPDEAWTWDAGTGRADQSWQPGWPIAPGSVLAVPVELGAAAQAHGLTAMVVTGARVHVRGFDHEPPAADSLRLRLVVAEGAAPPLPGSGGWDELAPLQTVGWTGACPGGLEARFQLNEIGVGQGQRVWLLLDYSHVSQVLLPTAPLLEWFAPGETAAELDVGACSWTYRPLENSWARIPAGRLRVDALLEPLDCDRGLPFVADFDATFPDLECWTRTDLGTATDPGWQSSAVAEANGSSVGSHCFFPDPAGTFVPPGLQTDPAGLTRGEFLFVNSDLQGDAQIQTDSLFTPWLIYSSGAVLGFSTLAGGAGGDMCRVLLQTRSGDQEEPWSELLSDDVATDSLYVPGTVSFCGVPHGLWTRVERELAPTGTGGELRLCFAYHGNYGNGWSLDSIRVDPAPPASGPFDGPPMKSAELGRIHPNPFNPETVIPYRLREPGAVRLEVYNIRGQRVAVLLDEAFRRAGEYRAVFRPGQLASGVYLARLEAAGVVDVRRLVYLK
ncbi:MAG: T9SS type A sorting domain-containing protein [Candidatus Delongbacteria bacterium]